MRDRTLPIIYAALLGSIAIYGVLAYIMTRGGSGLPFAELLKLPFVIPLYVMAAISYPAAFFLSGIMAQDGKPLRTVYIARWSVLESIVIYGLLAAILNHDVRLFLLPVALALLGFAKSYPTAPEAPLH